MVGIEDQAHSRSRLPGRVLVRWGFRTRNPLLNATARKDLSVQGLSTKVDHDDDKVRIGVQNHSRRTISKAGFIG